MFARLLLLAAIAAPMFAQETDDVSRFLTEFRAKYRVPREDKTATRVSLAELTKRVKTTTDRTQKAGLYRQIAVVNRELDDLDAAIAAARMAHDLAPENAGFTAGLALLLAENRQNAEASAILGADAGDGGALVRRADALVGEGEKDLAMACLQLAQKALPDDAGVDDRLGIVYLRAERADDAIRQLNRAEGKAPDSALIHLHLAFAFAQKDYRDYARSELKLALDSHPSDDVRGGIEQLRALLDAAK